MQPIIYEVTPNKIARCQVKFGQIAYLATPKTKASTICTSFPGFLVKPPLQSNGELVLQQREAKTVLHQHQRQLLADVLRYY